MTTHLVVAENYAAGLFVECSDSSELLEAVAESQRVLLHMTGGYYPGTLLAYVAARLLTTDLPYDPTIEERMALRAMSAMLPPEYEDIVAGDNSRLAKVEVVPEPFPEAEYTITVSSRKGLPIMRRKKSFPKTRNQVKVHET